MQIDVYLFAVNLILYYGNIVLCCVSKIERLFKQTHVRDPSFKVRSFALKTVSEWMS